ncbi:MAG: endo-1,4-beta-xylanase [Bacteroidales bacterium]|nr:endo-1,4-beta-xylanase [Bacteroidales bacterium]
MKIIVKPMTLEAGMKKLWIILLAISCGDMSCDKDEPPVDKNLEEYKLATEGLKDYFTPAEYFYMGVAIPSSFVDNQVKVNLIKRHFNSVTAENDMKWSSLQPTEGTFTFTNADKIVAFAQANEMKVRGHCLCWHNQIPAWIFNDGTADASKELVLQRLRTHITTVVNHFKGKVYAWDVVNEAIDDGSSTYRASKWYTICGEDYIFEAFKAAREADPDAILFYNDYTAIDPTKRDKIYSLLVKLQAQNLVDGMGLQGHWNINYPSNDLITAAFDKYKSLGLELQITEFDVSVYGSNSDPESLYTAELALKQAVAYGRFFIAFRNYKSDITGITFWGLADDYSWLDNFPVAGRKNYPFLFDENYLPKQAYFTVINF